MIKIKYKVLFILAIIFTFSLQSINVFSLANNGIGLTGEYYDNMDFTNQKLKMIDPIVGFDWRYGTPSAQISTDTFSARWTGQVEAKYSQTYTFYALSDGGVRLWVKTD